MIPVYGFLQGDTLGLLILASPDDTARAFAERLVQSASVRVAPRGGGRVVFRGETLADDVTLRSAGVGALDRLDVVFGAAP